MDSFEAYLRPVIPYLSPQLIVQDENAPLVKIARTLPGSLAAGLFGFECRLGEEQPSADLLIRASIASGGRESLTGLSTSNPALFANPIWQRIERLAMDWSDPASPLYMGMDDLWLEFDAGQATSDVPVPSIFFGPRTMAGPGKPNYRLSADEYVERTTYALRLLHDRPLPGKVAQTLAVCFLSLPDGATAFQAGTMLARKIPTIRLCITGMSAPQIQAYLARIGWDGSQPELASVLALLSHYTDHLVLDIDIGETVYHKLGLECYIHGDTQPGRIRRWGAFLGYLVENGFCRPQKREALLGYPGHTLQPAGSDCWPKGLSHATRLFDNRARSFLWRAIHHIKIAYQPEEQLEAKAYLSASYHWHIPVSS